MGPLGILEVESRAVCTPTLSVQGTLCAGTQAACRPAHMGPVPRCVGLHSALCKWTRLSKPGAFQASVLDWSSEYIGFRVCPGQVWEHQTIVYHSGWWICARHPCALVRCVGKNLDALGETEVC